jgi:hypothetical protein
MCEVKKEIYRFSVDAVGFGTIQLKKIVVSGRVKSLSASYGNTQLFRTTRNSKLFVARRETGTFLVRDSNIGRELIQLTSDEKRIDELEDFINVDVITSIVL